MKAMPHIVFNLHIFTLRSIPILIPNPINKHTLRSGGVAGAVHSENQCCWETSKTTLKRLLFGMFAYLAEVTWKPEETRETTTFGYNDFRHIRKQINPNCFQVNQKPVQ